jgi:hypothetical protein
MAACWRAESNMKILVACEGALREQSHIGLFGGKGI